MNSPATAYDRDLIAPSAIRILIIASDRRIAQSVADTFGFSASRWRFINTARQLHGLGRDSIAPVLLAPRWRELPRGEVDEITYRLRVGAARMPENGGHGFEVWEHTG